MSNENRPRRRSITIVQVILGLVLGPIAVWVLMNALPIRSGRAVLAVTAAITLGAALIIGVRIRTVRPGAIAFAATAALLSLLLVVVVADS